MAQGFSVGLTEYRRLARLEVLSNIVAFSAIQPILNRLIKANAFCKVQSVTKRSLIVTVLLASHAAFGTSINRSRGTRTCTSTCRGLAVYASRGRE
ncbi:hypothetical protein D3C77_729890 [compost metagenome]